MKFLFSGCSFTYADGFSPEEKELYSYDQLLAKKFRFKLTNISDPGLSNYRIFMNSLDALVSGQYDCIVTQWTSLNRLCLYPGASSKFYINSHSPEGDYRYRDLYFSEKDVDRFRDTFLLLNSDYSSIVELVRYVKILESIAKTKNIQIVFVNGIINWTEEISNPLELNQLTKWALSDYTNEILGRGIIDDYQLWVDFCNLQSQIAKIDKSLWVNMFKSWAKQCIDYSDHNYHPGIKSHQLMADQLSEHFIKHQLT